MADIVAANVTHTIISTRTAGKGGKVVSATLTFGDGSLTYNANAYIPITRAKLGLPEVLKDVAAEGITDSGYAVKYDPTQEGLRLFYADLSASVDAALIELPEDTAVAASNVRITANGW